MPKGKVLFELTAQGGAFLKQDRKFQGAAAARPCGGPSGFVGVCKKAVQFEPRLICSMGGGGHGPVDSPPLPNPLDSAK